MRKIRIYNQNQFTPKGLLKKKAREEMGLTFIDVEPKNDNEAIQQLIDNNKYTAKTLKERGYHSFTSPYIFTHIEALNSKNERVYIYASIFIGRDNKEMLLTPMSLYKELTK